MARIGVSVCAVLALAGAVLATPGAARADVRERDHVRLRIDYLELRTARAVDVTINGDGKPLWRKRLPAQALHVNLAQVAAPAGTAFSVVVEQPDGPVIGSAGLTDAGSDATETVRQGEVARLIISTRGVPVWTIPEVRVRAAKPLDDGARKQLVERLLELNRAVIDHSDGQLRFEQFTIEPAASGDVPAGGIAIGGCDGACPLEIGTPKAPAPLRVATADVQALLRAFEHAYLGVPAQRACWSEPVAASAQARADADADADDDDGDSKNDDDDDDFDCRFHLVTTLRAGTGLRLMPGGFPGPTPRSDPAFRFADDDQVDFSGAAGPAGLDDDTINAEIARHGEELAKCMASMQLPTARIKLSIRGEDGRVTWVRVNDLREGSAHACVARVADTMRFPASKAKRTVAVFEMSR